MSPALADEASIAHGKEIATEACSACHQVAAEQLLPPPVSDPDEHTMVAAPSFYDIARAHGADADYMRNKILLPQHPMRAQDWNDADLKAVIDYIQSLPRK